MIEAWHRGDERDVCESMAIADTAVSAGLKEATRRLLRPCPPLQAPECGVRPEPLAALSVCHQGGPARAIGMLEGYLREAADANAAAARLQRIDPWVIVDNFHCHITVSDGELGRERAPTRR